MEPPLGVGWLAKELLSKATKLRWLQRHGRRRQAG
jgi:hypothetical protein